MIALSKTPLYPEAHIKGTLNNPANGHWPCALNHFMCGYWWSLIVANNPPDLSHPFSKP